MFVCCRLVAMYVCQLLSDIRLIWRGWTGGGRWGVSSAGSRAEVNWDRCCITSLPPFVNASPHPVFLVVSYHMAQFLSTCTYLLSLFILCCLPANAFIMSHNPPQLTTNWCEYEISLESKREISNFYINQLLMLSSKCVTKVLHVSIFNRIKSIFPESQEKQNSQLSRK